MTTESKLTPTVEVKELAELQVAYIRHVGPYQGDTELFAKLFGRLLQWAGPRGLADRPDTKLLTVYHDDPNEVEEAKQRLSACISVPTDTSVDGEIDAMSVAGGMYAVARFEVSPDRYGDAWAAMYGGWLPTSGYEPDDRPAYELCCDKGADCSDAKHVFDICIPVRKA